MYREFFIRSPLLTLPIVALVIFIVVFGRIVLAAWRARASQYDSVARLPLDREKEPTP